MQFKKNLQKGLAGIGMAALVATQIPLSPAAAAELTFTVTTNPNPLAPSTPVTNLSISFSPSVAISTGDIVVNIPDEFDTSALTTTNINVTEDGAVANDLTTTTAIEGSATSKTVIISVTGGSLDATEQITVSFSGGLVSPANYGQYGFGVIASADTGIALVSVTNEVIVRAKVMEMLKMEISGGDLVDNVIDFGNLVLGTPVTKTHDISVDTNRNNGFTLKAYENNTDGGVGLHNVSTITDAFADPVGGIIGDNQFGITATKTGTAAITLAGPVSGGQYSGLDGGAPAAITIASSTTPVSSLNGNITMQYGIQAGAATVPGLYENVIVYVVSPNI